MLKQVGVVAIGRNEGQRLRQCLQSVTELVDQVVYVDSGSTDGSVEMAKSLGAEVVNLDLSIPFTAARARNEGFARLLQLDPQIQFVQFVDGDCEIVEGWLDGALDKLNTEPEVVVVCGRRRERFPEKSIYNQLCDMEWDTPVGETTACGGDSMMRVSAFQAAGGFNASLIAGEEPELCVRLCQQGGKIFRLDAEMTWHDAQMMHFSQWWKRSVRAGHAFAEGAWIHGTSPAKHWVRETGSICFWGLVLPIVSLAAVWPTHGVSLFLLMGYPVMFGRIFSSLRRQDVSQSDAILYATSCVLGKFAQARGAIQFAINQLTGKRSKLIEYKTPT